MIASWLIVGLGGLYWLALALVAITAMNKFLDTR